MFVCVSVYKKVVEWIDGELAGLLLLGGEADGGEESDE